MIHDACAYIHTCFIDAMIKTILPCTLHKQNSGMIMMTHNEPVSVYFRPTGRPTHSLLALRRKTLALAGDVAEN